MLDRSLLKIIALFALPVVAGVFAHRRLRRLRAFTVWGRFVSALILVTFAALALQVAWIFTTPLPRDAWPAYWWLMLPLGFGAYALLNLFTYQKYATPWEEKRALLWKAMPEDPQISSWTTWKRSLFAIDDAEYEALRSGKDQSRYVQRRIAKLLRNQEKDLSELRDLLATETDPDLVEHRREIEARLAGIRSAILATPTR